MDGGITLSVAAVTLFFFLVGYYTLQVSAKSGKSGKNQGNPFIKNGSGKSGKNMVNQGKSGKSQGNHIIILYIYFC